MSLKSRFMFLMGCILLMTASTFAQSTGTKPSKTITACKIGLTGAGSMATFRFGFRYSIKTDNDGAVKEVTKISPLDKKQFLVKEEEMPVCIKTWQLEPLTKYVVSFSIGTTGGPDYISVTNDKETLKIILD